MTWKKGIYRLRKPAAGCSYTVVDGDQCYVLGTLATVLNWVNDRNYKDLSWRSAKSADDDHGLEFHQEIAPKKQSFVHGIYEVDQNLHGRVFVMCEGPSGRCTGWAGTIIEAKRKPFEYRFNLNESTFSNPKLVNSPSLEPIEVKIDEGYYEIDTSGSNERVYVWANAKGECTDWCHKAAELDRSCLNYSLYRTFAGRNPKYLGRDLTNEPVIIRWRENGSGQDLVEGGLYKVKSGTADVRYSMYVGGFRRTGSTEAIARELASDPFTSYENFKYALYKTPEPLKKEAAEHRPSPGHLPSSPGVYMVKWLNATTWAYSYWTGDQWCFTCNDPEWALRHRYDPTVCKINEWKPIKEDKALIPKESAAKSAATPTARAEPAHLAADRHQILLLL